MQTQIIQPQQVMIECVLTPNGANTNALNPFPSQDFLIGRPIVGLQLFTASDMPRSPLSGHLPVIPDALFPYAFLNINRSGQEKIVAGVWYKNVPLCSLRHVWNNNLAAAGNLDMFRCDPQVIQWPDTTIAFPFSRPQAEIYSVPVLVSYLLPEQDPTPYRMAFLKGNRPAIKGIDF